MSAVHVCSAVIGIQPWSAACCMLLLQVRTLKQQNNALADEASSAKFKLVDAQQEQLKLKGQVVEVRRASNTIHLSQKSSLCCAISTNCPVNAA